MTPGSSFCCVSLCLFIKVTNNIMIRLVKIHYGGILITVLGAYSQLCVEDIAVDSKLSDTDFVDQQLACVMADNDEPCDEFGVQIKSK